MHLDNAPRETRWVSRPRTERAVAPRGSPDPGESGVLRRALCPAARAHCTKRTNATNMHGLHACQRLQHNNNLQDTRVPARPNVRRGAGATRRRTDEAKGRAATAQISTSGRSGADAQGGARRLVSAGASRSGFRRGGDPGCGCWWAFARMSAWWMPWRRLPRKDAATRRNARGRRWQPAIPGSPNGATCPAHGRALTGVTW